MISQKLTLNIGVKDFSLDTKDELIKILEATNQAKDLNFYVRIRYFQ